MTSPPQNLHETQVFDRRVYSWCTCCRNGQGHWVSHHTTATHEEGYRSQRRRMHNERQYQNSNVNPQQRSMPPPQDRDDQRQFQRRISNGQQQHAAPQQHAQLSLFDYMDAYLPPEAENTQDSDVP
jgi:hypothetical protein